MKKLEITAFEIAGRFLGYKEIKGQKDNPFIVWCLSLCNLPNSHDEVPWCSASAVAVAMICKLPNSFSAAARSWLGIGREVPLSEAQVGFDLVVFKRGGPNEPGPEVRNAPGHVGWFGGIFGDKVLSRGGNQSDAFTDQLIPIERVLSVRRLYE